VARAWDLAADAYTDALRIDPSMALGYYRLRSMFVGLDALMRAGLVLAARICLVARRPGMALE